MKIKRNLIFNKRNGQASVTLPSKIVKKFETLPKKVFIEISDSLKSKGEKTMKFG